MLTTSTRHSLLIAAFAFLAAPFLLMPAYATTIGSSDKHAQFDALYSELIADPTNMEKTIQYSELAVELGDYEAAIPPLERLLMQYPTSSKIKLKLGVLYYSLGSHDTAKHYLMQVSHDPSAEADYKIRAENYLNRM